MKILRISKYPIDVKEESYLSEYGLMLVNVSPTLFSATTALKISKVIDKQDIDIVEVSRQEDATAAISALKICEKQKVRIVFKVAPNFQRPRNIHSGIIKKVDGWIFGSQRLSELFKEELHNRIIIKPTTFSTDELTPPDLKKEITIAWIGEIKNTERLKSVLSIIDELDKDVKIRISGSGVARDVMPAVKYSRALKHQERIIWLGEEYDKAKEISLCQAAVQTDNDITETETEILLSGRRVLLPEKIKDFVEQPDGYETPQEIKPTNYVITLRNYYLQLLNNEEV